MNEILGNFRPSICQRLDHLVSGAVKAARKQQKPTCWPIIQKVRDRQIQRYTDCSFHYFNAVSLPGVLFQLSFTVLLCYHSPKLTYFGNRIPMFRRRTLLTFSTASSWFSVDYRVLPHHEQEVFT